MDEKPEHQPIAIAPALLWVVGITAIAISGFIFSGSPGFGGNPLQPFLVLAGLAAVVRYILVRTTGPRNAWPLAMLLTTVGAWIVIAIAVGLSQ